MGDRAAPRVGIPDRSHATWAAAPYWIPSVRLPSRPSAADALPDARGPLPLARPLRRRPARHGRLRGPLRRRGTALSSHPPGALFTHTHIHRHRYVYFTRVTGRKTTPPPRSSPRPTHSIGQAPAAVLRRRPFPILPELNVQQETPRGARFPSHPPAAEPRLRAGSPTLACSHRLRTRHSVAKQAVAGRQREQGSA